VSIQGAAGTLFFSMPQKGAKKIKKKSEHAHFQKIVLA
jgi:hypothetical protein